MREQQTGVVTLEKLRSRREEILQIAAAHDASNVRVFGSVARGDAQARSDVDFLVDLVTDAKGFDYFGMLDELRRALEEALEHEVDVVVIGRTSIVGKPLAERIQREAVPL